MSRISQYPLDTNIEGSDKWIGTSVNNANATKNFSVDNVIGYINSSGGVDSQNLRYTYQNVQGDDVRLASTISFTPSLGDNVPFAGITEWIISAFSKEVKDVRTYYNTPLIGNTILITNAFNPSNWAIFRWDSVTVDVLDPDFYTIALTHIDSTGELVVGQDYLIALLDSVAGGSATWGNITGTLSAQTDLQNALDAKQDDLVSGTNIKTINSTTLLGSGDIAVQPTLVSGTNIKTINSTSLLGSGDLVITTPPSGVSGAIQFSNGSGFASDAANFFWNNTNKRLGIGLNTVRTSLDAYNYATPPVLTVSSQKAFDIADSLIGGIQGIQHPTLTAPSGAMYFKSELSNAAQGKITFETGSALGASSEKMVIGFNGNVGIGTTTPIAKLQVKGGGATSATTSLLVQNSASTNLLTVKDDGGVSMGNTLITSAISNSFVGSLTVQNTTPYSAPNYNQLSQVWLNSGGGVLGYFRNDGRLYTSNDINSNYFVGNISGSISAPVFGVGSNGLFFPSSDIAFTTSSTEKMRITSAGNVGMGTATPLVKLQVEGTIQTLNNLNFYSTNNSRVLWKQVTGPSDSNLYLQYNDGANDLIRTTLTSAGNLGIGTTTPLDKLEINDGTNWTRSGGGYLFVGRGAEAAPRVSLQRDIVGASGGIAFTEGSAAATTGSAITQASSRNLVFLTSNGTALTERMRIDSVGNVGIGTTSPTAKLQVKGSGATSATTSLLVQNSASADLLMVRDDGNIGIGTNAPTQKLYMKNGAAPMFGIDTVSSQTELKIYNQSTYGAALKLNSDSGKITWANGSYIDTNNNGLIMQNTTANTVLRVAAAPSIGSTIFHVTDNTFATGLFLVQGNGNVLIGTTTDIASSKLTVDSTTQGLLPPRMTNAQVLAIVTPAAGLMVYNTTISHLCVYQAGAWVKINHSPM
jgi:hypothetical protein